MVGTGSGRSIQNHIDPNLLKPTKWVRQFRRKTICAIHRPYKSTSSPDVRKNIIAAHRLLLIPSDENTGKQLRRMLSTDIKDTLGFFHGRIDEGTDLYERFEIWAW